MRKGQSGFTLVEVTIILLVLAILALILLPVIDRWIQIARIVKVREDLLVIGTVIPVMLHDIGECCFWLNASTPGGGGGAAIGGGTISGPPVRSDSNRIELLISDGDIPSGNGLLQVTPWLQPFSVGNGVFDVDFLEYHLSTNTPGGGIGIGGIGIGGIGFPYRRPSTIAPTVGNTQRDGFARPSSGFFNAEFSWRGAYLTTPINPDPWGNRYMVNVQFLDTQPDLLANFNDMALDVFVLSVGPDEEVDTFFAMDGAFPGDDDEIFIISGNAR